MVMHKCHVCGSEIPSSSEPKKTEELNTSAIFIQELLLQEKRRARRRRWLIGFILVVWFVIVCGIATGIWYLYDYAQDVERYKQREYDVIYSEYVDRYEYSEERWEREDDAEEAIFLLQVMQEWIDLLIECLKVSNR